MTLTLIIIQVNHSWKLMTNNQQFKSLLRLHKLSLTIFQLITSQVFYFIMAGIYHQRSKNSLEQNKLTKITLELTITWVSVLLGWGILTKLFHSLKKPNILTPIVYKTFIIQDYLSIRVTTYIRLFNSSLQPSKSIKITF